MYVMGLTYLLLATSLNTSCRPGSRTSSAARVMAIYLSSLLLGVPLGALIQGKLASLTDLRVVVVGAGWCSALFVVVRLGCATTGWLRSTRTSSRCTRIRCSRVSR